MNKEIKNSILYNLYTLKSFGFSYHTDIKFEDNKNNFNLPDNLNSINEITKNCNLCGLYKKDTKENLYLSNMNAKIVFMTLKPMSINSIFDKILNNVLNLNIEQINLLSILKCTSLINEENLVEEINLCKSYIHKQLELINPKLIICLGNSYQYLLNTHKNISTIRGTTLKYNNIDLIPIYHPNMLLRNPSLKTDTMKDLKKIKNLLGEL